MTNQRFFYKAIDVKKWRFIKNKVFDIGCVALPWHFEFYILKCKIFFIDFLDELGNFKQKKFYTSKCKISLHFKATDP